MERFHADGRENLFSQKFDDPIPCPDSPRRTEFHKVFAKQFLEGGAILSHLGIEKRFFLSAKMFGERFHVYGTGGFR